MPCLTPRRLPGKAAGFGPALAEPLEEHRHALAAAHAHGLQSDRLVVELQAVQQRGGDSCAGHAERVTDRDSAAVDVELVNVDAEVGVGRNYLGGECLVDLHQVDVVDRHPRPAQGLAGGLDRAEAFQACLDPIIGFNGAECEGIGSLPSGRKCNQRPDCRLVRRIAEMDGDRPSAGTVQMRRRDCFKRIEALSNAIFHGNLEVSSTLREKEEAGYYRLANERRVQKPWCDRRVYVTVRMSRLEAMLMIRDEGPGFDPASLPDPTDPANLERVSGRGLLLIQTFMDRVEHNETGNQITMIKRRYS